MTSPEAFISRNEGFHDWRLSRIDMKQVVEKNEFGISREYKYDVELVLSADSFDIDDPRRVRVRLIDVSDISVNMSNRVQLEISSFEMRREGGVCHVSFDDTQDHVYICREVRISDLE